MSASKIYTASGVILPEDISDEDGGAALIHEGELVDDGGDGCLFVKLQSWDDGLEHPLMTTITGKRVRITVEILDD